MISGDYRIIVPKKYKYINLPIGRPVKNRLISFRKSNYFYINLN